MALTETATKLRDLRESKGWSLRELERLSGVSSGILADLERQGEDGVQRRALSTYAKVLSRFLGFEVIRLAQLSEAFRFVKSVDMSAVPGRSGGERVFRSATGIVLTIPDLEEPEQAPAILPGQVESVAK